MFSGEDTYNFSVFLIGESVLLAAAHGYEPVCPETVYLMLTDDTDHVPELFIVTLMAGKRSHCLYALVFGKMQSVERLAEIAFAPHAVMGLFGTVYADLYKREPLEAAQPVSGLFVDKSTVGKQSEGDTVLIAQLRQRKQVPGKQRFSSGEVDMAAEAVVFAEA